MTTLDDRPSARHGSVTVPSPRPAPVDALDLSAGQVAAVDKVERWFNDPQAPLTFRLFGYAGTGKTTLAQAIVNRLRIADRTLYAAFTGKAAHVLQSKGCEGAQTIHSLIYAPRQQNTAELDRLIALRSTITDPTVLDELLRLIRIEQRKLSRMVFDLREASELSDAALLVLDEASMVSEEMAHDLLSFGTKILVLGDPAQLPPVIGSGFFTDATPDHLLTEVHRSALDSPVTRIATAVRNAPVGSSRLGVFGADGNSGRCHLVSLDDALGFDQVLCWRNATRWELIQAMRERLGRPAAVPVRGDRVTTLANNRDESVFNGAQFEVRDARVSRTRPGEIDLLVRDDDGALREMTAWAAGFEDHDGERIAARRGRTGSVVAATFAQCVTVHRAQGSQWDRVLVVDESASLWWRTAQQHKARGEAYAQQQGHLIARQWLYTACTRAAQQIVISSRGVQ